ncbi:MAG: hypothetical protein ACE5HO_11345 [bacterium]
MANYTRENLTASRIKAIISQNRSRGVVPELGGVRVTVVGASSGGYEKMSSRRMSGIRDFWLAYFAACGADLRRQHYGGALLGGVKADLLGEG